MKETYKLLLMLMDPQKTPRLPKYYRDCARKCIQDFPIEKDMADIIATIGFFNPR
jgi:hypothetical protein